MSPPTTDDYLAAHDLAEQVGRLHLRCDEPLPPWWRRGEAIARLISGDTTPSPDVVYASDLAVIDEESWR